MKRTRLTRTLRTLGCALATLGLGAAANAADLVNVSASPNGAPIGTDVTITATKAGSPNCGWQVRTGAMDANNEEIILGPYGFPDGLPGNMKDALPFQYPAAGTYTITVEGAPHGNKPFCENSASTTITVEPPGNGGGIDFGVVDEGLVEKLKVTPQINEFCPNGSCQDLIAKPQVETAFGFRKPGGVVGLVGKWFGPSPGEAYLHFKRWNGAAQTVPLEVIEWTPTMVGVRLPGSLQGFRAQMANFEIRTANGGSGMGSFQLNPLVEIKELHRNQVQVVSCSQDANFNACGHDVGLDPVGAIVGYHKNSGGLNGVFSGDDQGQDSYRVALKNGWGIRYAHTVRSYTSSSEWVGGPTGSPPSARRTGSRSTAGRPPRATASTTRR